MTFTPIFIAVINNSKKKKLVRTHMSINDKWTNKMWSTNIREHYSAIGRNEILVTALP